MEIRELAERVLFSDTIEGKLEGADRLEDGAPGAAIVTPDQPGRPAELALDNWRSRKRVRFAEVRRFHTEKERGLVLHFFANHELLALELIALALLKFPETPPPFRRGLVRTLTDEQEHLRLYRQRMAAVGVEFGEIPVSDFFWRSISTMETPMDFVARLSLTLEQANLDYAPHYRAVYESLGDGETAALMARIYTDEIRHVSHGLRWFNNWRDPAESEWSSYRSALAMPMTPSRAKGIGFNREGRLQAGFSADFIDELELFAHSKGRCPAVYWFNPACDSYAAVDGLGFTPSKSVRVMASDLSALPMLLSAADDAVIVERRPSTAHLGRLHEAGLVIPEFAELTAGTELADSHLAQRNIRRLHPWGWSPDSARFLAPLFANLTPEQKGATGEQHGWSGRLRELYSKAWSAELLRQFLRRYAGALDEAICGEEVVGAVCESVDDVAAELKAIEAREFDHVLVKGAFGAAGQNQIRFAVAAGLKGAGENKARAVERLLEEQGCVVVEPLLKRVVDLSAQLEIDDEGEANVLGVTRFITDNRGQYLGSFVHRRVAGLDERTRRFLYGGGREGRWLQKLFGEVAKALSERLAGSGYRGPLGIDAMVYDQGGGLRLKPVVEINPRFTMGRIALELARRVSSARAAMWLILRVEDMKKAGFGSAADFAAELERREPLRLTPNGELISEGVLFTTDPAQAESFTTALVVAKTLDRCKAIFAPFEGRLPEWTRHC